MSSPPSSLTASLTLQGNSPQKYPLSANETIVIGRSPECQIVLDATEYITVSRCHVKLQQVTEDGQSIWQVSDMGTTNGTLVNDQKIEGVHSLKSGDRITLGWKGPEFIFEASYLNPTVLVTPPDDAEVTPETLKTEVVTEEKPEPVKAKTSRKSKVKTKKAETEVVAEEKSEPAVAKTSKKSKVETEQSEKSVSQPPKVTTTPPKKDQTSGLTIWNCLQLQESQSISDLGAKVNGIAISPYGKTLAIAGGDKLIKLWNLESQSEIVSLKGHKLAVNAVAFSPDGQTLVSSGADKLIKLWNLESQSEIGSLSGHKLGVNAVAFSPDGKTLATAGADKSIKLWNIADQSEIGSLSGHKLAINAVAFSPDGQTLVSSGADKLIKLWNIADQSETVSHKTNHQAAINYLNFKEEGEMICSCGEDKTVKLILKETGEEYLSLLLPVTELTAFCLSGDGQNLICAEGELIRWLSL